MDGRPFWRNRSLARLLQSLRRFGKEDSTAEIIATVSHEIRSPLTTIKGFTKTLIDRWDRLPDDVKLDMLRAVNGDADRVTRLLSELLDVSRLEIGKLPLHLQRVDLREVAGKVVTDLGERSENHKVELVPGDAPEIRADPDKVRQVITNFIENALKYTDGGLVQVRCKTARGAGELWVSDEGSGIPGRLIDGMFEKFARRESPGSPSGTGLGLYICKGLVETHGGQIGARSIEGTGSTFWFRIPLAKDSDE